MCLLCLASLDPAASPAQPAHHLFIRKNASAHVQYCSDLSIECVRCECQNLPIHGEIPAVGAANTHFASIMRIAILDDDPAQLAHLVSIFQAPLLPGAASPSCETFTRGTSLRHALRRETFDLLLLDWNVPDLDGVDLLRWLREEKEDFTPVLMLSSRAAERDVAAALTLGADDYVVKPFRPLELRARLARLYARRPGVAGHEAQSFDNWGFDSAHNTVTYQAGGNAAPTVLTESEFRLALALFRNIGKPVSRSYLIEKAGYAVDNMSSRTLDSHIYRLRGKLKLDGQRELALLTVYGVGYRLQANHSGAR